MTDTVPYYEDFTEIKKKIWSMLTNAVKDRSSPFRIPVFICGNQSEFDGRIVVLRKADEENNVSLKSEAYEVLARKYRPRLFSDLIGQEAMVRTLKNAFEINRVAHAFMMTGVRGVGKTTTARLLARALNYSREGHDAHVPFAAGSLPEGRRT